MGQEPALDAERAARFGGKGLQLQQLRGRRGPALSVPVLRQPVPVRGLRGRPVSLRAPARGSAGAVGGACGAGPRRGGRPRPIRQYHPKQPSPGPPPARPCPPWQSKPSQRPQSCRPGRGNSGWPPSTGRSPPTRWSGAAAFSPCTATTGRPANWPSSTSPGGL